MRSLGERALRKVKIFRLRARGYTGPLAQRWVDESHKQKAVLQDLPPSVREVVVGKGLLPERARDLINHGNPLGEAVSERDYYLAHPLNGIYSKWLDDHVTARRIFSPYLSLFRPLHYHAYRRDLGMVFVAHSGDAKGAEASKNLGIAEAAEATEATGAAEATETAELAGNGLAGLKSLTKRLGGLSIEKASWTDLHAAPPATWKLTLDGDNWLVDEEAFTDEELEGWLYRKGDEHGLVILEPPSTTQEFRSTNAQTVLDVFVINPAGEGARITDLFLKTRQSSGDAETELISRLDPATGEVLEVRAQDPQTRVASADAPRLPGSVDWLSLAGLLTEMCDSTPQLQMLKFEVELSSGRPHVERILSFPALPDRFPLSDETAALVANVVGKKAEHWRSPRRRVAKFWRNSGLKTRRIFAATFYPKGLIGYQATRWPADVVRDLRSDTGVSFREKMWAYRHGFLSYRLPQYGITRQNHEEFVPDFQFRWIRHINGVYRAWLEDKMTLKYLFPNHKEAFPGYYFHVENNDGDDDGPTVTPLMDAPLDPPLDAPGNGRKDARKDPTEGAPHGTRATLDDVLNVARELGTVAVKPDEGSHGEGFFKLDYGNGGFIQNGEPISEEDLRAVFSEAGASYLVSEFVEAHPTLKEIYPQALPTLRLLVYKPDGKTPIIGNTYMRIGSKKSGFVDNLAAGGMVAKIDPDTGRFYEGEVLEGGRVKPQPHHPDTGVFVEGVVPRWDEVKDLVLALANELPELEFLGFDIAVTPDGLKVIEINRSPDYPRTNLLTKGMREYLLGRVEAKQRRLGLTTK